MSLSAAPSDSSFPFSLLSCNLCLFPVGMRHSLGRADKDARVREFVQHLKRAVARRKQKEAAEDREEAPEEGEHGAGPRQRSGKVAAAVPAEPLSPPCPSLSTPHSSSPSLSSLLPSLLGADIVCAQEVFSSLYTRKWRRELAALSSAPDGTPAYPYVSWCRLPSLCRGHLLDAGLCVLSRFPIEQARFVPFRHNLGIMRLADKGFLHVTIRVPSAKFQGATAESTAASPSSPDDFVLLHVLNTHFHSNEGSLSEDAAQQARDVQIEEVRQYLIDEGLMEGDSGDSEAEPMSPLTGAVLPVPFSPSPPPASTPSAPRSAILLVGDLNIEQHSSHRERMQRTLRFPSLSALPPHHPTQHNCLPFCNHASLVCSDYAVATSRVRFHETRIVKQAQHLSDHYPVLMRGSITQ